MNDEMIYLKFKSGLILGTGFILFLIGLVTGFIFELCAKGLALLDRKQVAIETRATNLRNNNS